MLEIQSVRVPEEVVVVLCDMDGVATRCTDSINFEATRQVLVAFGVAIDDEIYKLARGMSREKGIERILDACGRRDLLAQTASIADAKNRAANRMRKRFRPYGIRRRQNSSWAPPTKTNLIILLKSPSS
jgi:beta-phosphoglucomutase-like phosphatase (HAD superfamily)